MRDWSPTKFHRKETVPKWGLADSLYNLNSYTFKSLLTAVGGTKEKAAKAVYIVLYKLGMLQLWISTVRKTNLFIPNGYLLSTYIFGSVV